MRRLDGISQKTPSPLGRVGGNTLAESAVHLQRNGSQNVPQQQFLDNRV
jgi:hypothetical protein